MKKGGILGEARLTAGALLLTFCFPAIAAYAGPPGRHVAGIPFEPMTPADLDRGHMRGTGCVWMDRERGPMRFVAVDDKAMVKLGGGLRMLRPARGAGDMFPFTYDRWVGERTTITIILHSPPRRGGGASVRMAFLRVVVGGSASKFAGLLDCGT